MRYTLYNTSENHELQTCMCFAILHTNTWLYGLRNCVIPEARTIALDDDDMSYRRG